MNKEKPIKVEAEVTSKNNVSSGIGKGFGIVIGVFLALIVIAVSCGILISSNAKEIEEKSNEITANAIKEAYRTNEEYQQQVQTQIQKTIDDSLPAGEKTKEKNDAFEFSPNSIVNSQKGISLSIDDVKYDLKSDWGKITEITVTVLNQGSETINPKVLVLLHDSKDRKDEWGQIKAEINFEVWDLSVGEHITKKEIVDIPFNDINLTKNLQLMLVEAFDYNNRPLVVVEKEFKP